MTVTVYVGLDYDNQEANIHFADSLSASLVVARPEIRDVGLKINLDSIADFSSRGLTPYEFVRNVTVHQRPVFVDMKMWNGGRTMRNIAKGCADLGVSIINVYTHAGEKFMQDVLRAIDGSKTKLYALTVLTHYTDADTQKLYGKSVTETVRMFAEQAKSYGAQGLILPGTCLDAVRDIELPKLCPGIRPDWYRARDNDQEQTVTPRYAVDHGATEIVVGSAVRKSDHPGNALERILKEVHA